MNLRLGSRLFASSLLAFLLVAFSSFSAAQTTTPNSVSATKYRAVFHVTEDDPKKWAQVLNNARYTQTELGAQNVDIAVVMNGGGISMLKLESPVAQKIEEANKAGIKFHVCQNTMATQKVTKADMLPQADYVPSGIGDVIKLQREGWSYVKN